MGEELIQKIPDVLPPEPDSEVPESDYGAALEDLKFRTKLHEVLKLEHALKAERLMLAHRKNFSWLIFGMCSLWLVFIGIFLWYFSSRRDFLGFLEKPISDSVLIALITTTTANVLGLFFIVAHWLFPTPPSQSLKSSSKQG